MPCFGSVGLRWARRELERRLRRRDRRLGVQVLPAVHQPVPHVVTERAQLVGRQIEHARDNRDMRAAVMHSFASPLSIETVDDPVCAADGAVVRVLATGVCRSDWHGWMGHDASIELPHVPGHELCGEIVEVGPEVHGFAVGDRVTVPFCCGCGVCEPCRLGETQVCEKDIQPGFTIWGSFAELVALPQGGSEPGARAGGVVLGGRGVARLPVHDGLGGAARARRRACGRVGRRARLRRRRARRGDDRDRRRRAGHRRRHRRAQARAGARAGRRGRRLVGRGRDDPRADRRRRARLARRAGLEGDVRELGPLPAPPGPPRAGRPAAGGRGPRGRPDGARDRPRAARARRARDGRAPLRRDAARRRLGRGPPGRAGREDDRSNEVGDEVASMGSFAQEGVTVVVP